MLCVCLIAFLNADWKRIIGTSDAPLPPEKNVIKSDSSGVFIRTAVFGFNEQDTTVDNKDFKRIEIPEEPIDRDTLNAGKPQIPYIRLLIAVPDSCNFEIIVYTSDYTLFEDYLIYPIPRIVFETDTSGCVYPREVYTYDASFYGKDTLYPNKFYEVISDGHWRDQRVIEIFLYPVQFNLQQKLMYFYTGLNLRIEYAGEVVENENGLGPFEDIGREILLNYPGVDQELPPRDPPAVHYYTDLLSTDNVADYIIVTHEDFITAFTDSSMIHEFAQWRVDHNQFDVGIVKMCDIYDEFLEHPPAEDDSAKALRDFLVYAYNNWHGSSFTDGHFAYSLFIGDWDYVPTKLSLRPDSIWYWVDADEFYFKDLDSDDYDDIMLGRWPVKGVELVTIAQKTINYEQTPVTGDTFRRRGLLMAGESLYETYVDDSRPYFCDIGYDTITVRRSVLDSISWKDTVNYYLNQGEILVAYFGHGAPQEWQNNYDTTEVKALINGNHLPVVLSKTCYTANFQWDHPGNTVPAYAPSVCFGEHFLFNSNGGCIAFFGATKPTMRSKHIEEIFKNILRYQTWILGKALLFVPYWYNKRDYCLLGDPALDLGDYTAYPNLPDLVVRPQGIDISLLSPYPYPATNDTVPIQCKVFNIGGSSAYNVKVYFEVNSGVFPSIYSDTVTIEEIQPRGTAVAVIEWPTGLSHPDTVGDIGNIEFYVEADPDSEITESWEYNNAASITKQVVFYPGWSKKIPSPLGIDENMPALANLDGTGSVEIVCPGLDSLYVFDPEGNLVSPWPVYFKSVYGIVLGDIDGNNTVDIVAVSPESIKVYDYQGNMLNGWPVQIELEDYQFTGLPALGRIETVISDALNVVVAAKPRSEENLIPMKIFVYNFQGLRVYRFNSDVDITGTCRFSGPSIENVINGGNDEIIISYCDKEAQQPPSTEIFNCNGLLDALNYSGLMISALVDMDGDVYADVITGCSDTKLRAYNANTQMQLWPNPPSTGGIISSSPAVGDINPLIGFEGVEIAFGNNALKIYAIKNIDGYWWFPWPYETEGIVQSSPALARLEGKLDLNVDIVVGSYDMKLYALDYSENPISPHPLPLFDVPNSAVIGDIDGDRKSETILTSQDGFLHVWENINSYVPPYTLEWPQFHHDYQRTGVYGWVGRLRGGDANPKTFSTGTTLSFSLENTLHTKIKIYDAEGNPVKTLVNQTLPQGTYNPVWFGKNDNYSFLPNGIYFIEIKVKNESKIIPVEINR